MEIKSPSKRHPPFFLWLWLLGITLFKFRKKKKRAKKQEVDESNYTTLLLHCQWSIAFPPFSYNHQWSLWFQIFLKKFFFNNINNHFPDDHAHIHSHTTLFLFSWWICHAKRLEYTINALIPHLKLFTFLNKSTHRTSSQSRNI